MAAGRQAREGRELVHQGLQVLDLLDDGARAFSEDLVANHLSVALLQSLSGELNRRQRILDLMGDALRDLPPRLHALDLENLRDVLEEQHGAWRSVVTRRRVTQRRRRGEQGEGLVRL